MSYREILNESIVIVLSGLFLAYPISLFVIYVSIDVFELPTLLATTINTAFLTIVGIIRVFTIRLFIEKQK